MNRAVVVSGEASETDSEDECYEQTSDSTACNIVQGTLVKGEDSESDDDTDQSVASAVSALEQFEKNNKAAKQTNYNSLLHKKLRENNAHFHNNLDGFCNNIIHDAANTLSGVNQQLVRSEVTLQNAVTSLKTLNVNIHTVTNKIDSMLSANFLPNVKLDK